MKNEAISGKISRMLGSLKYTAYNAKKASPEEKEDRGYNFHIRLPMKFKKGFYIYIYILEFSTPQEAVLALAKYYALTDHEERKNWLSTWDTLGKDGNSLKIASVFTKAVVHTEDTRVGSVEHMYNRFAFFE